MARRNIILIAAVMFMAASYPVAAQQPPESAVKADGGQPGSIEGTVKAKDGSVVPGVTVSVKETRLVTVSDAEGKYSLADVPQGQVIITASLPGFADWEMPVNVGPGQKVNLDITLEVKQQSFEVVVSATAPKLMTASENISMVTVSPREIFSMPSLGQKDIFRAMQLMPGVSASNESSSGLYVRGGTPDQNLVLFDGFTAYDVDHFFGIFSAFNSDAIESITLYKGGFESKYGGRLSSVMDITGKSRMGDRFAIGAGVSFLSYNGYVAVPMGKWGSFLAAGRKSFQSSFSDRIRDSYTTGAGGPGGGGPGGGMAAVEPDSTFYDVNARSAFNLTARDTVTFSFYKGADDLDSSRKLETTSRFLESRTISGDITSYSRWGNRGMSAAWDRKWTDALSSRFTAALSRYFKDRERSSKMVTKDSDTGLETTFDRGMREENHLRDLTFRNDSFLLLGRTHNLEFGAEVADISIDYGFETDLGYRPGAGGTDSTSAVPEKLRMDRRDTAFQYAVYAQDTWIPFSKFTVTPGLRATYFDRTRRTYLDPRLSVIYHATDRLRLKAAGGRYHQFARDLVREDLFEGDQDVWTLSDGVTQPVGSATHFIAGVSYETPKYLWDVELYRKNLRGLSEMPSFNRRRPPPNLILRDYTYTGSGVAEGVEFAGQKKTGSNIGWFTYTIGRVMHTFPDFSTEPYRASHDSTHEFKLIDLHQWRRFTFSGSWVYATGKPFTEPLGITTITMPDGRLFDVVEMANKNGARLPPYHRLDFSAGIDFLAGESYKATAGVSVFNAYNRRNVWRKEYDAVGGELISTDINYLGLTVSAFLNVNLAGPEAFSRAGPAWLRADSGGRARPKYEPEQEFDFYGAVVSADQTTLVVSTRRGNQTFTMNSRTVKGSEFEPGALVHVYYKTRDKQFVVTRVVQKIKNWDQVKSAFD
ncbi:MAG: TonB-dependent receptor [Acidobacteria bacterium]|nr:TonB-dependent receptor [Acidobacteriota bacterium]